MSEAGDLSVGHAPEEGPPVSLACVGTKAAVVTMVTMRSDAGALRTEVRGVGVAVSEGARK